jgi:SAM-dependent methyltransferase
MTDVKRDIASGSGALARRLPEVVALHISRRILTLNVVRHRVQADGERLPFANDSFAASASAFGVNHFPRPVDAIREMARVSPLIALITWERPGAPYAPAETVFGAIEAHCGRPRSQTVRLSSE